MPATAPVVRAAAPPATATQTVPPSAATERGSAPSATGGPAFAVAGSTRTSVPAVGLTTQIPSGAAATSVIPAPASTEPSDGSRPSPTRHSFPSADELTHAASSPTAIAVAGACRDPRART